MSLFKKIQEKIIPISNGASSTVVFTPPAVKHEFCNFETAYRIGILAMHTEQNVINDYKTKLEKMGFEVDVILYVDSQDKVPGLFLPTYDFNDLEKKSLLPNSPRTDRFSVKRFDLLLNLYFTPYPQLVHLSNMSYAKCRVAPFVDKMKDYVDLMIPMDGISNIEDLINSINTILKLKPYERKLD